MKNFQMSLFFAAIFFVTSCSEKEFVVNESHSSTELADSDADLKTWFINSVLQNKQGRIVSQNNKKLTLYFDWNKSLKQKRNDKSEGVIVPIFEFEDTSVDEVKFKKVEKRAYSLRKFPRTVKVLYLNKDLKGKNTYQIITYMPMKGATLSDYSGHTVFSDVKGNFVSGFIVKNNKVVGNFTDAKKQKNLKVNCGTWETVEWDYWYLDSEGVFTFVHGSNTYFDDSGCGGSPSDQDGAAPGDYNEGGGGDSSGGFDLQSTNETVSEETTFDNGQTKTKVYKWIFLYNRDTDPFNLYSREEAQLVRSTVAPFGETWTYSAFRHIDTGIEGVQAGVIVSIETANVTTSFNQTIAQVSLYYNVNATAGFLGFPTVSNYNGNQYKNFYPN